MNKLQEKKLIKSIKADAQLTGANYDTERPGQYCVIGGMVATAGKEPETFFGCHDESGIDTIFEGNSPTMQKVVRLLRKTYGLTIDQLWDLQGVNDNIDTTPPRRRALLKLVAKFAKERDKAKKVSP